MPTKLWDIDTEIRYFREALRSFLSEEQLFYQVNGSCYAYVPKSISSEGNTLQSRNSSIGHFTEKWCKDLLSPIARKLGLYAVNDVKCDDLALPLRSGADLAFCKTNSKQQSPKNIKLIFEIKMSIVNNYMYSRQDGLRYLGDYKTHRGTPSLLRSDSMLKAIGKAVNIRASGDLGNSIPIVILGNSPITKFYEHKVDHLLKAGIVQGFWSLNPNPCDSEYLAQSPKCGFSTLSDIQELQFKCNELVNKDMRYFSSMIPKEKLGAIIELASRESSRRLKAEKFISLISE